MNNAQISFIDFIKLIWNYKFCFLFITLSIFSLSIIYALCATPKYKAEVSIVAPNASTRNVLNLGHKYSKVFSLKEYELDNIYQIFLSQLNSEALKYKFFLSWDTSNTIDKNQAFKKFSKRILVKPFPQQKDKYLISASAQNSDDAKKLLNEFLSFTEKNAKLIMMEDFNTERRILLYKINQKMDNARILSKKTYSKQIMASDDYLARLRELEEKLNELENTATFFAKLTLPINKVNLYQKDDRIITTQVFPIPLFIGALGLLMGILLAFFSILSHSIFLNRLAKPI
ncbi:Wzz/FepE/Etk N-terminal domain-containing protein [Legionella sp. km772]|uniref:Wzz/FepE/Etk N-terminal domain-containing protein n=1 Tax=Legionella sp. km772 TaxID=2498111 RepID=UPI000F8DDB45|nr:Wzz/FepE/Etk N-terminal domain-containing protein [Legionella sp. km772]RUR12115.1 hypothetical protein ELY15_06095 [Legionella sp. km772]